MTLIKVALSTVLISISLNASDIKLEEDYSNNNNVEMDEAYSNNEDRKTEEDELNYTNDEIVNIAGKQRMITQLILKDYAVIGMSQKVKDNKEIELIRKELTEKINNFDNALKILNNEAEEDPVKEQLTNKILMNWKNIKGILKTTPDENFAKDLKDNMEILLKDSNKLVNLFTTYKNKSKIINIAGKQRMLSQRIASRYMYISWGVDKKTSETEMKLAMDEFEIKLNEIYNNGDSQDHIKLDISNVKKKLKYYKFLIKGNNNIISVYKQSNILTADMDKITKKYVNLKY